jgi:DNA-binding HxlR family transcriptional regulator
VRGYGQYWPITRAAEVLATRWTPIVVRNLLLGCETFSEIAEGAPGIPRSVLSARLRMLVQYGLVERTPGRGYRLTPAGEELEPVLDAMGVWGSRWLEVAPEDLDAHVVLWSMCRLMRKNGELPAERVVLRFDLADGRRRRFWVVLGPADAEVCVRPPGFDVDAVVATDSHWLAMWHMGRIPLAAARRRGLIQVEGRQALVRELAGWGLSRFAGVGPAAVGPAAAGPARGSRARPTASGA